MCKISILFKTLIITVIFVGNFPTPATSTSTDGAERRFQRDATYPRLNKPVLFDGDLNAFLSPYLFRIYPSYEYHIINQDQEPTPSTCQRYADEFCRLNYTSRDTSDAGKAPARSQPIVTTTVSFTDLQRQMTLCSCIPLSQDSTEANSKDYEQIITSYLLSHLARLPPSLRMHVDYVISFPMDTPQPSHSDQGNRDQKSQDFNVNGNSVITPHAFMSNRAVAFFGMPTFGTWIHEFAHALDIEEGISTGEHTAFTENDLWMNALASDPCVADGYALNSASEAFAQAAILKLLFLSNHEEDRNLVNQSERTRSLRHFLHEGRHLQRLLEPTACMQRQLDVFDHLQCFNPFTLPNHCSNSPNDALVLSTDGIGRDKRSISALASAIDNSRRVMIEPSTNTTSATWMELWLATVIILLLFIVVFT